MSTAPAVTLRSPGEILSAVPYLLGFAPRESLVVVGLCAAGRICVQLRVDRPPPPAVPAVADAVVASVVRARPRRAVLVVYRDATGPPDDDDRAVTTAVSSRLAIRAVEVCDALVVRDGRWWSLGCDSPSCCGPAGTPLTAAGSRVAAELVGHGLAAAPSREALVAELAPSGGGARLRLGYACARAEEEARRSRRRDGPRATAAGGLGRWRAVLDALPAAAADGVRFDPVGDDDAAALLVVLLDQPARDRVAGLAGSGWPRAGPLLADLVRRAPDGYVAPVASVLALLHAAAGDGVRANVALDRALADDAAYPLALLLRATLARGLHVSPALLADPSGRSPRRARRSRRRGVP